MKSGKIDNFAHLSQFSSLEEFNNSNMFALEIHGQHFTKGERIAFTQLTRFSVKEIGICYARICKLVQSCQSINGGISRSTFERMLRKAKLLGIISIVHTIRETGGYSHNVYIFHRFERPKQVQLTERQNAKKPEHSSAESVKNDQKLFYLKQKH